MVQLTNAVIDDKNKCIGPKDGCHESSTPNRTYTACCCSTNLCNHMSKFEQQPFTIFFNYIDHRHG